MTGHLLRRLGAGVPTLFVVVTLAFFAIRLAPGGPFDLERPLEPAAMESLRRIYGLDRPLIEQYGLYLGALLRGDLGPSFSVRDFSVAELFRLGLPLSAALGGLALALALLVGGLLGSLAAVWPNGALDHALTFSSTLGLTVPGFVVAPLLQIVFGLTLFWLPVGGYGGAASLVLPVITLALPQVAIIARLTRAALIETLRADHIRTLRALGLPAPVVVGHALRAAALPVVTYLGPAAAGLLTGSVVVETVFGLPGIGRYFVEGAINRDYPLVMGTVVLVAVFVIVFNVLVDLATALLDPRVRGR